MADNTAQIINLAINEAWENIAIVTAEPFREFPTSILEATNLETLRISRFHVRNSGEIVHDIGATGAGLSIQGTVFHQTDHPMKLIAHLRELPHLKNLQICLWGDTGEQTLEAVPAEVVKLEKLRTLDLRSCGLTELPISVCSLDQLKVLNLTGNHISEIPPQIGQMKNLRTLNLSSKNVMGELDPNLNSITTLPPDIRGLTNLRSLDLRGNPLTSVPPEILNQVDDPKGILDYYFEHQKRPLHEVKLIVVGQGSVGKTSLVQRLIHDNFNPGETKTEGIAISRWQVPVQSGDLSRDGSKKVGNASQLINAAESKIRINVWDFGGQEIMHATHQFFLTKRSIYVLVLDSRLTQEENRVEYWLKIIQSFGGDSPVLIVGNKTDQHPLDIDRSGLRKKYPNIIGIHEISAATGVGLAALQLAIGEEVNKLPHVRDLLPKTWFVVKTELENLGHDNNYINRDQYLQLCTHNQVTDDASQRLLIGFLHDLGVILHFQEEPRLEALGILNPQWVTNGVYRILNAHQLFQNKGVLTVSMLNEILDLPEYPRDKRLFIVDMMRKFELCYDIESNEAFLVPDLLPKDEPYTREWKDALAFQYNYTVLPTSIISRFIVRMNAFVYKTIWRSGAVLRSGGNTALVKADTEERKIYVWVDGDEPTRRDFLSAIRGQFDAIHRTIARIEVREKVPVPGYPRIVVDYEHLLKLESKNVEDFIPEGLDDPISVRQLLDGITILSDRQAGRTSARRNPTLDESQYVALDALPAPAKERSLAWRGLSVVFASVPRVVGRVILDVFGRDKAADSTAIVLGYAVLVLAILLLWGVLDGHALVNNLKAAWRFFFPIK